MIRAILDCITCMPNSHFLGLEMPKPWNKVNTAGLAPWQKDLIVFGGNNNNKDDGILKSTEPKTVWENEMLKFTELTQFGDKRAPYNTDIILEPVEEEIPYSSVVDPYKSTEGEAVIVRHNKNFPKVHTNEISNNNIIQEPPLLLLHQYKEARRSWPEPREKGERRMTAANYAAVEIHGFFGLIDDGSDGVGRMLVVHVPKWIKGYFLDIKQGDTVHVYHAKGLKIGGALNVLSTGRHKYYGPGRRVTTCTICVPEDQWAPFASY